MTIVNVLDIKTHLSCLTAEVEAGGRAGGEVIIAWANKPVVRLVTVAVGSDVAEPTVPWQGQPAMPRVPGRPEETAALNAISALEVCTKHRHGKLCDSLGCWQRSHISD